MHHLFEEDVLQEGYKIVESSLVKEQELLQTSAVFLFSAGLVANFLSGAPWEMSVTKVLSDYPTRHTSQVATGNTSQVWAAGAEASSIFRALWGMCMLLTLGAVISSYVARTTLFRCWNLVKIYIDILRKEAKDYCAKQTPVGSAEDVATEAAIAGYYTPGKLKWAIRFISACIGMSKACFGISLMLWLSTILYAIVSLSRLAPSHPVREPGDTRARTRGGIALLVVAGSVVLVAIHVQVCLMLVCLKAYTVWHPDVEYTKYVQSFKSFTATFNKPAPISFVMVAKLKAVAQGPQPTGGATSSSTAKSKAYRVGKSDTHTLRDQD